jgi:hypothetical protein
MISTLTTDAFYIPFSAIFALYSIIMMIWMLVVPAVVALDINRDLHAPERVV